MPTQNSSTHKLDTKNPTTVQTLESSASNSSSSSQKTAQHDLNLNHFKINEIGSVSDSIFSKLDTSKSSSTCTNCKFSKIECKCKLINVGSDNCHNPSAYDNKSKENVNRDLSKLLSEIKNSNLSVMKSLEQNRVKTEVQEPDHRIVTTTRVNLVNT